MYNAGEMCVLSRLLIYSLIFINTVSSTNFRHEANNQIVQAKFTFPAAKSNIVRVEIELTVAQSVKL